LCWLAWRHLILNSFAGIVLSTAPDLGTIEQAGTTGLIDLPDDHPVFFDQDEEKIGGGGGEDPFTPKLSPETRTDGAAQ
jgi:hypothetical protein